jgi:hypothetical protein
MRGGRLGKQFLHFLRRRLVPNKPRRGRYFEILVTFASKLDATVVLQNLRPALRPN